VNLPISDIGAEFVVASIFIARQHSAH